MTRTREDGNPGGVVVGNAAEIVASIDDILTEILRRLPLKPLVRFKLVSKHWLALITSRQFCLLRNPAPNLPRGLFLRFNRSVVSYYRDRILDSNYIPFYPDTPDSYAPPLNFNFTINPPSSAILHSCHGLMLCCSSSMWDGSNPAIEKPDSELYVYNPTTKCFAILPHCPSEFRCGASLVFDPFKSSHYKVLLVEELPLDRNHRANQAFPDCDNIQVLIYSSETGIWTNGGGIGGTRNIHFKHEGVYWNGSVHWRNKQLFPDKSGFMLRYHVDSQTFHEMPTPPVLKHTFLSDYYFGESRGHLHFVEPLHFIIHPLPPQFNVYEMKSDYSEWFISYRVNLLPPLASYPDAICNGPDGQNYYVGHVMSLIRGDDNEGDSSLLVLRIPGKILKYNLLAGTLEKLADIDNEFISCLAIYRDEVEFRFLHEHGLDYIPSLCSV